MSSALSPWLGRLGIPVRDEALFRRALTHGSTGDPDYQRLEFLGDRVLGLVIAERLYGLYPDEPEGRLSQRLNRLVSGSVCAGIARRIGVGEHLRLGKQARDDGAATSDNVLGDVVESLIGAIYLDAGFAVAETFIHHHWDSHLREGGEQAVHPKSALQEWAAANRRALPVYTLLDRSGPDHALRFTVAVEVRNVGVVEATAASKQAAETLAAKRFLERYT